MNFDKKYKNILFSIENNKFNNDFKEKYNRSPTEEELNEYFDMFNSNV